MATWTAGSESAFGADQEPWYPGNCPGYHDEEHGGPTPQQESPRGGAKVPRRPNEGNRRDDSDSAGPRT
jgi:hypothetical protein